MNPLSGKHIVLGVCGSIAAYKAADLASKLTQQGALVDVILTDAAQEFVAPLTFRSLTGRPVFTNMYRPETDLQEEHVAIARRADLILIAPASATTLARLAYGLADDFLSLTCLASKAPIVVAPAMDSQMWEAPATRENVETLRRRGVSFVGPVSGRLASGHTGSGRFAEPLDIVAAVKHQLVRGGDLTGVRVIVTAGGTREPLDPVRFISNRSSGKMGYALAEAAVERGADVTLVTAATGLQAPFGAKVVPFETFADLRLAVLEASEAADCLVMAAAVSDFRPATVADEKIKKGEGGMTLNLVKNEDFLHEVSNRLVKVIFAAETSNLIENARRKTDSHGHLDLICANDVSLPDAGFAVDTNRVTILDMQGGIEELPLMSKYEVAHRILDRAAPLIAARKHA